MITVSMTESPEVDDKYRSIHTQWQRIVGLQFRYTSVYSLPANGLQPAGLYDILKSMKSYPLFAIHLKQIRHGENELSKNELPKIRNFSSKKNILVYR